MLRLSKKYPSKRAFITGAASGLGLALSEALAREGWTLGLADVNTAGLDQASEAIASLGGNPLPYVLDVSNATAFMRASASFLEHVGGVDLVINNAGIAVGGLLEETTLAHWHDALSINLLGVVHGCHAFLPAMKEAKLGHIINVASIAAVAASPYMAAYNTAKAGILGLSETLYGECKGLGVAVSVVMPFFFKTNIASSTRGNHAAQVMTRVLVDRSTKTADEVAAFTLRQAGKGKLHILYPRQAWITWHWKRLWPKQYLNRMVKLAQRTARFVERVHKSK